MKHVHVLLLTLTSLAVHAADAEITVLLKEPPMPRALAGDDVVFMYAANDLALYKEYGVTVLAWGGADTPEKVNALKALGVHTTGSMWCLTAGAKELHNSAELRDATARDIEGKPIAVPWLFDHTFEGTPSWWGCTNNPVYREFLRSRVRKVMSGGADGLHVDDHMGVAHPSQWNGGCFCDSCVAAFRGWLKTHSTPERLETAKVSSFDGFDYRQFVRGFAQTLDTYMKSQSRIPLRQEFVDCQLELAAENVRELGALAAEVAGHPVTLSANTGLPGLSHTVVSPYCNYLVGEVEQHAADGAGNLLNAVSAYRMAEAIRRPLAATASGQDWAFVKEKNAEGLVRTWIALSYACGQRLMAPHHQWCFSKEKGTHWYDSRAEAYAPLYQFVRKHGELFRETKTLGPLAVSGGLPETFETKAKRDTLEKALGKATPMQAGEKCWLFPRETKDGTGIIHLLNLDYDSATDTTTPQRNRIVTLPEMLYGCEFKHATLYSYDAEPLELKISGDKNERTVTVPELRLWSVLELK